jgi:hypothetical protein
LIELGMFQDERVEPPTGDRYAEMRTLCADDTARVASLDDLSFAIADILPAA